MKRLTAIAFALVLGIGSSAFAQTRAERTQERVAANPDAKWWEVMDTGPFISDTFRIFGPDGDTAVLKGIAIEVGPEESHTLVFDTETMRMVAGFEGTVKLAGTPWDGKHGGNSYLPKDRGAYYFATDWGPGWAIEGDWSDPREPDAGKPNGPLPDERAEYLGLHRHRDGIVLQYTVDGTPVMEMPALHGDSLVRHFDIGEVKNDLQLLVSDPIPTPEKGKAPPEKPASLLDAPDGVELKTLDSGRRIVSVPAGTEGSFSLVLGEAEPDPGLTEVLPDPESLTGGGPRLFPEPVEVSGRLGPGEGAWAVDSIPLPTDNPWESKIRFGGFDFFPDGKRVACSTWNGDVWIGEGIDGDMENVTWRRFASGLYQTLGLVIVDGVIHTQGRDQITRLHDRNGDGEADYYECFNNDVRITEGFHEFAFDLRTDDEGNFYFSKGMPVLRGGRGFAPWTRHNGAILRVSPDGEKLERVAWGLRAPGGLGVGPEGQLTTGENEGSWVPRCKITWSDPEGGSFHGVVPSEWDGREFVRTLEGAPTDYEKPLCWLPYYVDNSSGSQFWVPEDHAWKNHAGGLLHLSYGKSSLYRALVDEVDGQVQGGVYRLPVELTTAVMRGRFHPHSGELYLIGFRGWQTNGGTGFQRVRRTGEEEEPVPLGLRAHENGLIVEFSDAVDPEIASDPRRYAVSKWDYVWGPQYGSGRFSIDDRDEEARQKALEEPSKGSQNQVDTVPVRAATVLDDGKTVFLYVPDMTPAMQMEIKMDLADADGETFRETIWNTVHQLRPGFGDHGLDLTNLPEIDTEPVGNPGLILSMAHGSTDDAVVVDRLAVTLDEDRAATPFIDPRRGREMVFEGSLVVEDRDDLAFRLEGTGWASLRVDGETLAEGELPLESDPVALEPGPHNLFCNFRRPQVKRRGQRPTSGASRMQLLWSGRAFVWEPVPPESFRHLPNALIEAKDKTRRGRNLFAAVGCIQCHEAPKRRVDPARAMPELLERPPGFAAIGDRLQRGWIEQWVRQPEDHCPSVAPDEAHHVAAWLATRRRGKKQEETNAPNGDPEAGKALAEALHFQPWADELATEARHTPGGLYAFLRDPTAHNPHTTFPHLRLEQQEAADLAAWIRSRQPEAPDFTEGDPAVGREVVAKRCLVCHGQPVGDGVEAGDPLAERPYEHPAKPLDEMWDEEWLVHGCLSEEEGVAPELGLGLEEKQALLAFRNVDSDGGLESLNRFVPHEYAGRALERLSCLECHSGENELPDITLAGEKLRDEWLAGLFHGETLKVRPWLEARMPAFPSRAENLATALAHRAGVTTGDTLTAPDPPLAGTGGKIAGMTGYACTTCHAAGSQPALQAFEGQGPNLQVARERLRYDYYRAWMHWPQRFQPTTIMPKYTADKKTALNPSFFEGDADRQFEAVWQWMRTLEGAEDAPPPKTEEP